ncbi:hypothetical protein [Aegicerativicinus sediminis]|uniref:hypothetical protein n=1 Tax=Aegicerativicinus sediminis TaxID=2893202 RepID=UPI001E3CA3D9|nr:hypothetical protein [Aegicerativicinus sediminis]
MNTPKQILSRTLQAFPASILSSSGDENDTKEENSNNLADGNTIQQTHDFIVDNFGYLHKHVFLYESNSVITGFNFQDPNVTELKTTSTRRTFTGYYLYNVEELYIEVGDRQPKSMIFAVPFCIKVSGRKIQLITNTFSRNIKAYVDEEIAPMRTVNSDKAILSAFETSTRSVMLKLDINKAVKQLWEDDTIDARQVTFKEDWSEGVTRMDENLLYKDKYPNRYLELLKMPLRKTTFKVLNNNYPINHFYADPSMGTIQFPVYPDVEDHHEKFLNHLLSKN